MTIYAKPPLDPALLLKDAKSMRPEETAFVDMEVRLAAEGILNRYRSKGDAFIERIAMHLFSTITKRQPKAPVPTTNTDGDEGNLF